MITRKLHRNWIILDLDNSDLIRLIVVLQKYIFKLFMKHTTVNSEQNIFRFFVANMKENNESGFNMNSQFTSFLGWAVWQLKSTTYWFSKRSRKNGFNGKYWCLIKVSIIVTPASAFAVSLRNCPNRENLKAGDKQGRAEPALFQARQVKSVVFLSEIETR